MYMAWEAHIILQKNKNKKLNWILIDSQVNMSYRLSQIRSALI